MTPFAALLSDICRSRRIRQKELAYRLGVDPSYLSAVTAGRKGPPSDSFISKLNESLQLSDEEQLAMQESVKFSQTRYRMPKEANPQFYEMIWKIFASAEGLKPAQMNVIEEVLKL